MMDMEDNLEGNCKSIADQIKALSKKSGKDVMGMIHEHMESGDEEETEAMDMDHRQPDEELAKESEDAENQENPEASKTKKSLIIAVLKKKNKENEYA